MSLEIIIQTISTFFSKIPSGIRTFLSTIPVEQTILFDIAIIIILAAILAVISKLIKQELIPAYIIAGIILGPLLLGIITNMAVVKVLSIIGIAFLLFVAGLELSFKRLKEVGKVALGGGLIQIISILVIGALIAIGLKFQLREAIYIGVILALSSTVVVVKILADKKQLDTLHSRIILGILLLQDIAAIIALSVLTTSNFSWLFILLTLAKTALLLVIGLILKKVGFIDKVFNYASRSTELLFLISIAFVFFFSVLAGLLGLSIIIGAFIAGLCLAGSYFKTEVEGKIRPLRDFFAIIFFVSLGIQLTKISIKEIWLPLIIFFILIVVVKPLIVAIIVRLFKYKRKTSFLTGMNLAQISEFSLIIAMQGLILGHISSNVFSITVILAIVSIAITPYFLRYDAIFFKMANFILNPFSKVSESKEKLQYVTKTKRKIIMIGCHRIGSLLLKGLERQKQKVLVIDYNPTIINALIKKKIACIYGDITSEEVLDFIDWKHADLIISTMPILDANLFLINYVKKMNQKKHKKIKVILTASRIHDALFLYEKGADYVLVPPVLGGEKAVEIVSSIRRKKIRLKKERASHLKFLRSMQRYLY